MIDYERATEEKTLPRNGVHTNPDLEDSLDVVGRFFDKDLDDIEDDVEEPGKEEQELEEDLGGLDSGPLELEEMSDMHEELTQLTDSRTLETASILTLPPMATDTEQPMRRPMMRRRRSDEQEENAASNPDAGESDAVMTYLREFGRVPMITHEREIDLAQRIEN